MGRDNFKGLFCIVLTGDCSVCGCKQEIKDDPDLYDLHSTSSPVYPETRHHIMRPITSSSRKNFSSQKVPMACKVCGLQVSTLSHLVVHMRVHTGEKPFNCPIYSTSYTIAGLQEEIPTKRDGFRCPDCGIQYKFKSQMEIHRRIHTGVKPFVCEVCHKAFAQKNNLKSHMTVHMTVFR
ncbi:zinc finger protein 235-like [Ruditapes philippinarum]|uniref:zinc finger protein 235-like n=1 Tax=Ruditapes philippinarum TaxID=129788 RepID=UPI00295B283A|nr:zinc finger protein 235-like [Ruditapes philippinarum]